MRSIRLFLKDLSSMLFLPGISCLNLPFGCPEPYLCCGIPRMLALLEFTPMIQTFPDHSFLDTHNKQLDAGSFEPSVLTHLFRPC